MNPIELLTTGRVELRSFYGKRSSRHSESMLALVQDDPRVYRVRWYAHRWSCDCAAFQASADCTHLAAVMLVCPRWMRDYWPTDDPTLPRPPGGKPPTATDAEPPERGPGSPAGSDIPH